MHVKNLGEKLIPVEILTLMATAISVVFFRTQKGTCNALFSMNLQDYNLAMKKAFVHLFVIEQTSRHEKQYFLFILADS